MRNWPDLELVPLLLLVGLVAACDGPPAMDSSLAEAVVSGVVKVKGVPATGGTITFNPSNYLRQVPSRSAEIGTDGRYTVTTYTGDNQVTFGGAVASQNRGVGLVREYCQVHAGENQADFDLLTENSGKKIPFPTETKVQTGRRGIPR